MAVFGTSSAVYAGAVLVAAFAAFWPTYLSRPAATIDTYTHLHAFAMLMWCGLLIVQPILITTGRRRLHRALGATSYAVMPLLVVASLLLAHTRFHLMDAATFRADAGNLFLPLSAIWLFTLSYGLAIAWRRTPALHARFMIGTLLTMIDPVVGRLMAFYLPPLPHYLVYQAITFGATDLILVWLAVRDRPHARVRWAFPLMLAAFVPTHILWFTFAQSETWHPFAAWFRALPLT